MTGGAPGTDAEPAEPETEHGGMPSNPGLTRGRLIAATVVAVVVLVAGALIGGWLIGRGTPPPGDRSAAAGFARDMQTHHEQAVEMAMATLTATDDPEVRQLAYDIAASQAQQAGQLYGLLNAWGLPQASADRPMSWMILPTIDGSSGSMADHGMSGTADDEVPDRMPGMATDAQLSALRSATGVDAERRFLTLMIAHHQGGVAMAQAALQRTDVPLIRQFCEAVIAGQTSEIDYMRSLLDARGGPLP